MAAIISKIRLINFKRFQDYTVIPNNRINILVGDNEVGKSTILDAIDLVTSGNIRKVESIGLDRLLNIDAVQEFSAGIRRFSNLPKLIVELYLDGDFDHTMNGKNNTDGIICDGIRLVCEPNPDYRTEITESLQNQTDYFPYDYYSIRFSTFSDEGYTGYRKKIRSVLIDSTNMSSDYAMNDFVRRMYIQYTEADVKERAMHKSQYRHRIIFFKKGFRKSLHLRRHKMRTPFAHCLNQRIQVTYHVLQILHRGNVTSALVRTAAVALLCLGIDKSGNVLHGILYHFVKAGQPVIVFQCFLYHLLAVIHFLF